MEEKSKELWMEIGTLVIKSPIQTVLQKVSTRAYAARAAHAVFAFCLLYGCAELPMLMPSMDARAVCD